MAINQDESSAQKHTPGPWHHQTAFGTIYSQATCVTNAVASVLTKKNAGGSDVKDAEAVANGNLIAAAPDLLEALKTALSALQSASDSVAWHAGLAKQNDSATEAARAAIAKAEGGAA